MKKWTSVFLAVAFAAILVQPVQASIYVCDVGGWLGTVDPTDNSVDLIGQLKLGTVVKKLTDVAIDPLDLTGQMYGVDSNYLYKVDKDTAQLSLVGSLYAPGQPPPTAKGANALAFNPVGGALYLASISNSYIFSVNKGTGLATAIAPVEAEGGQAWYSSGDLAFYNNDLYWTATHSPGNPAATNSLIKLTVPDIVPTANRGIIQLVDGTPVPQVWGLAVDGGHLYGVSGANTEIYKFVDPTVDAKVTDPGNFGGNGLGHANGATETMVPEPATLAVWGILVAVAVASGWRQRRKTA
jgi:hypothetical protein